MSEKSAAVSIDPSWQGFMDSELKQPYMTELRAYLSQRKKQRAVVYPHSSLWFNAFSLTPLDSVKVVILGQDPYHGPGQAHGLSFSVPKGVRPPPSLLNIFKEIDSDLSPEPSLAGQRLGCLEDWARQGVFLLNSVLTVEEGLAASHQGRGWEQFTDSVIGHLSTECENLVFMLWGSYAQKKGQVIDANRHCILKSPHPSPLSAHRGFMGCQHFSQANDWLASKNLDAIDWTQVS